VPLAGKAHQRSGNFAAFDDGLGVSQDWISRSTFPPGLPRLSRLLAQ
jgi:hypothetical protein